MPHPNEPPYGRTSRDAGISAQRPNNLAVELRQRVGAYLLIGGLLLAALLLVLAGICCGGAG